MAYPLGELSTPDDLVIPVGPAFSIGTEVNGTTVTFKFATTLGTDEAIFEVARPGASENIVSYFLPEQTYSQVLSSINPFDPDGTLVIVEVDLTQVPGLGNVFWWRAGSRNRGSTQQARPWPVTTGYLVGLTDDPDYGWVWSDPEWLRVGSFSDASPGFWAFFEIEALSQAGIVQGYPDGTFHPENQVTRDQMAVFIYRAFLE